MLCTGVRRRGAIWRVSPGFSRRKRPGGWSSSALLVPENRLALTLICQLAQTRQGLDQAARQQTPVPVRFDLAGWDTTKSLNEWLVTALTSRYSNLTPAQAKQLLDQHLVLPVLDGLDEMDPADAEPTRAHAAVIHLNRHLTGTDLLPVVVDLSRAALSTDRDRGGRRGAGADHSLRPGPGHCLPSARAVRPGRARGISDAHRAASRGRVMGACWYAVAVDPARGVSARQRPGRRPHRGTRRITRRLPATGWLATVGAIPSRTRPGGSRPKLRVPEQVQRWTTALAKNLGSQVDIQLTEIWRIGGPRLVRILVPAHRCSSVMSGSSVTGSARRRQRLGHQLMVAWPFKYSSPSLPRPPRPGFSATLVLRNLRVCTDLRA